MKINITKKNARFIVNEEKRKVVCIIDNTANLFLKYAEKNLRIKPDCDVPWGDSKLYPRLKMPKRFIGMATCSANDNFDVETGKLIAFSRAKDKINNSFFKRANLYINTIDDWLAEAVVSINQYGSKLEINTERRHERINELINKETE